MQFSTDYKSFCLTCKFEKSLGQSIKSNFNFLFQLFEVLCIVGKKCPKVTELDFFHILPNNQEYLKPFFSKIDFVSLSLHLAGALNRIAIEFCGGKYFNIQVIFSTLLLKPVFLKKIILFQNDTCIWTNAKGKVRLVEISLHHAFN